MCTDQHLWNFHVDHCWIQMVNCLHHCHSLRCLTHESTLVDGASCHSQTCKGTLMAPASVSVSAIPSAPISRLSSDAAVQSCPRFTFCRSHSTSDSLICTMTHIY